MKLLYAEDERAMSEAVTDVLTYHKYSVDAVYDGRDALDYARAEEIVQELFSPDAVVEDGPDEPDGETEEEEEP